MRHKVILGCIILLACILRITYLSQITTIPFYDNPVGDAKNYVARAQEIMDGEFFPKKAPFLSNALYPYFLASTIPLSDNLTAPRLIQFAVGILNVVVIYLLILNLFGVTPALIGAFLAAVYPVFIFFEGDLVMISLVVCTLNISLLMFVLYQKTRRVVYLVTGGVFLGLSVLGKPDTIMLAPAVAMWLFFTSKNRKQILLHIGYLTISVILTICPLTIFNWITERDFILLTANGGVNFYIGNHHGATGIFTIPRGSGLRVDGLYKASQQVAQADLKRPLKPSQVSRYWFRRARHFLSMYPGEALALFGKKMMLMLNTFEIPNHHSFYFYKSKSWLLKMIPLNAGILFALAVIGLIFTYGERNNLLPVYIFLIVMFVVSTCFFVCDRYRLPIMSLYMIFASVGIVRIIDMLRSKQLQNMPWILGAGVVALAISFIPFDVFDRTFKHDYKNLGNVCFDNKQYTSAIDYYGRVLSIEPLSPFVHSNMAKAYYMMGNFQHAIAQFQEEIKINPSFPEPYQHITTIYKKLGDVKKAQEYTAKLKQLQHR